MDRTLTLTRALLILFAAGYLALAVRNNCVRREPAGAAPEEAAACVPSPTRFLPVPADTPPAAREVIAALAVQLNGSAILGLAQGDTDSGLESVTSVGLVFVPKAVIVGGDDRPFVSLTVVQRCTGRVVAAASSYADRLGADAAAAYLRSQLTSLHEKTGTRLVFTELLLDPSLPPGFEHELRAQLRRAAIGSPGFDWYEAELSAQLGLAPPSPGARDFAVYVRAGGTRTELWTLTQIRNPGGESVLAERHEVGVHPALAFRTLPELVAQAARALSPGPGAP